MKIDNTIIERRMEYFIEASKHAGIKLTPQRIEIFREIASSLEHPDAETIFRAVRVRMPSVSLDTVYRTLWKLSDLGIIHALGPRHESVRFDANLEHHHHYVCMNCGMVRDFIATEFNELVIPDVVKQFGSVITTQIEVRGTCERCSKNIARGRMPDNKKSTPSKKGTK